MSKTSEIANLIANGQTNKQIIDAGYTKTLTYKVRKSAPEPESESEELSKEDQEDYDKTENGGWIQKVAITPEPEEKEAIESYQCPSCNHEWKAGEKTIQESCPKCGVEFE